MKKYKRDINIVYQCSIVFNVLHLLQYKRGREKTLIAIEIKLFLLKIF